MNKYLLVTIVEGAMPDAGPKAPGDICKIAEAAGMAENLFLCTREGMDYPVLLEAMYRFKVAVAEGREIILQYPFQPYFYHEYQALYAQLLTCLDPERTIVLLHDLNHLRLPERTVYQNELEWLRPFRRFIVHNRQMEVYLRKHLQVDQCIRNEVFDYLCADEEGITCRGLSSGEAPVIVFAGNLSIHKAPFLYELREEEMNYRMRLYGRRGASFDNSKLNYCGSYAADVLPHRLRGHMGLIWDGGADALTDTSAQKNYNRYNMPHKFSCYMAAGLPVIAWKEAAVADMIREYHVGYLIEKLSDINDLDLADYEECLKNAGELGSRIREGYFTRRFLGKL